MSVTALLDLRGRTTWDTGDLTAQAFRWPTDAPLVPLSDVAALVRPGPVVEAGAQVITPTSLDPATGAVRRRSQRYQGPVFRVGPDLQINDVLVSDSPEAPLLLVTPHLQGALVSSQFTALRPTGAVTGLWVWAVLNSASGGDLRMRLSLGRPVAPGFQGRLLSLDIPVPPLAHQAELDPGLGVIESTTHIGEEEAPSTWWRLADLRGNEWRLLLASPHPEQLDDGEPLAAYSQIIQRGRAPVRGDDRKAADGDLPVTDIGVLRGRPAKHWVVDSDDHETMSVPGDILLAAVGVRAHATVAARRSVLDPNVIAIRLKNSRQAEPLARYLNGSAGYALRQMLLRGSTVPHLSIADLSRMPVPPDALQGGPEASASGTLAERLERALWAS